MQAQLLKISIVDLAGAVPTCAQLIDAFGIDVETDHRHARTRKRDGDRQPDVAQTNNGDFSLMWQSRNPDTRLFS
jgi:hypothetical protein